MGGAPEWTAADAALALSGYTIQTSRGPRRRELERCQEYAFRYRWAGDRSVRRELKAYLLIEAVDLREREAWPDTVHRYHAVGASTVQGDGTEYRSERYLVDLCELAVLEETNLFWMKVSDAWAPLMRVDERVWRRVLAKRYEAIRGFLDIWCSIAHAHVRRRLR